MKNVIWFLACLAVLYRGYLLLDKVGKSNPNNLVWIALFLISSTILAFVVTAFLEDIQQKRKRK